jgi:hypothetical protein
MTQEEIISAANQLPLVERKALLREIVLNMREDVEVSNPPDKHAILEWPEDIERLHGFSNRSEDQHQSEK